ncbi:hypothetical protein [Silvibacterium acidisoli]|uniref:hypothetical protein n=1 Tax=Acidobacteriaceae bacterium ZG23-2 TaxID=2883246 RepID=UPI00406D263D
MRAENNADAMYALPRPAYAMQIPGILTLVGLMTFAVGTEEAMAFAAGTATVAALYMLWDWLFRLAPTRISIIFAINLLLGYGGGALNTYLTLPRAGGLAELFGTTDPILARGMASVLLVGAGLCFLGELYEKPLFSPNLRIPVNQKACLFIYLITLGLMAGFATHSLGFGGINQSEGSTQQNPLVAVLSACLTPIVTVAVATCIAAPKGYLKWSLGICALIDAVLQTTVDRRAVFYMTMLTIFVLRTSGYRIRGNVFKNILVFGGLGTFAFFGISFFMLLRLAGNQGDKTVLSLSRRMEIVAQWVADGSALERASEANGKNVKSRSFVIGFYADVLEGSMDKTPALGVSTFSEAVASVPRVLLPQKNSGEVFGVQIAGEETLADELFGLTYRDAANTILTAGAVDFGIVGVFLYPLLMAFLIRKILDWTSRSLDSFGYVFMVAAAVLLALPTEVGLFAYLSGLRNLIILATILYAIQKLPYLAWNPNSR